MIFFVITGLYGALPRTIKVLFALTSTNPMRRIKSRTSAEQEALDVFQFSGTSEPASSGRTRPHTAQMSVASRAIADMRSAPGSHN
jgi:hypothetical protein